MKKSTPLWKSTDRVTGMCWIPSCSHTLLPCNFACPFSSRGVYFHAPELWAWPHDCLRSVGCGWKRHCSSFKLRPDEALCVLLTLGTSVSTMRRPWSGQSAHWSTEVEGYVKQSWIQPAAWSHLVKPNQDQLQPLYPIGRYVKNKCVVV